jgi:hypothetical protein
MRSAYVGDRGRDGACLVIVVNAASCDNRYLLLCPRLPPPY